ncbi:hypothetical protein ACXFC5_005422, partial [Escherichia coli]
NHNYFHFLEVEFSIIQNVKSVNKFLEIDFNLFYMPAQLATIVSIIIVNEQKTNTQSSLTA